MSPPFPSPELEIHPTASRSRPLRDPRQCGHGGAPEVRRQHLSGLQATPHGRNMVVYAQMESRHRC